MDEVQWGPGLSNSGRDRRPAGRFARSRSNRAERAAAHRPTSDTMTGRMAASLVVVGFILLIASQYFPWLKYRAQLLQPSESGGPLVLRPSSMGIADAGALATPYYLCWLAALALCGACVFVGGKWRKQLFGAAVGSLVMIVAVMLPIVRQPTRLITVNTLGALGFDRELQLAVHRSAGMFCALAAVIALGLAMVVAVRGRVLPSPHDTEPATIEPGLRGLAEPQMPQAQPDAARDDDVRVSSTSLTVGDQQPLADDPETEEAVPDHSLYTRPRSIDYSQR